MPLVSLIVPIYNAETYLERCLLSIQKQAFSDYEVLLIDDGSTDFSSSICQRVVAKDHRFHLSTIPNQGEAAARNLGMSLAQGQYIAFVDADDEVTPTYLSDLVDDAICHQADLVVHGNWRILGTRHDCNSVAAELSVNMETEASHLFDSLNIVHFGSVWAKLFRADIIRMHQLCFSSDIKLAVDLGFVLDYLAVVKHVFCSYKTNYHYYLMVSQALSTCYWDFPTEERSFRRLEQSWERLLIHCTSVGLKSSYSEFLGNYINRLIFSILEHPSCVSFREVNIKQLQLQYLGHFAECHHPSSLYTRCLKFFAIHHFYGLYRVAVHMAIWHYHLPVNFR